MFHAIDSIYVLCISYVFRVLICSLSILAIRSIFKLVVCNCVASFLHEFDRESPVALLEFKMT